MMLRIIAKHIEGLNKRQDECLLATGKGLLIVDGIKYGGRMLKIPTSDIIDLFMEYTLEEQEKNKSVIKRGVVGSLLFGGAGLILGGLSGIGSKKQMVNQEYLTIRYRLDNEEKFCMFFIKSMNKRKVQMFIKKVKEQIV